MAGHSFSPPPLAHPPVMAAAEAYHTWARAQGNDPESCDAAWFRAIDGALPDLLKPKILYDGWGPPVELAFELPQFPGLWFAMRVPSTHDAWGSAFQVEVTVRLPLWQGLYRTFFDDASVHDRVYLLKLEELRAYQPSEAMINTLRTLAAASQNVSSCVLL